jgi:hypothetical protein
MFYFEPYHTPHKVSRWTTKALWNRLASVLLSEKTECELAVFLYNERGNISGQNLKRNFCRLLIQYSVDLEHEAKNKEQSGVAHLVRSHARFVADYVFNNSIEGVPFNLVL